MNTAHQALAFLASRCDGAQARDGEGFSRFDRDLGLSLAAMPAAQWSPQQRYLAARLAAKYRGQLERAGIEVETAPVGPVPQRQPKPAATGFTMAIDGDRAVLTSSSYPGDLAVAAVKAIPGRAFRKAPRPAWVVPLVAAQQLLQLIREGFAHPADTSIDDRLRAVVAGQAHAVEASAQTDAEIEVEGIGGELRPFQRAGVAYATAGRRVLIADEMGLGKTVQALATLWQLKAFPAIVCCPASLKLNWRNEARKWLPGLREVAVISGSDPIPSGAGLVIINYDILPRRVEELIRLRPLGLVCDESHYLKSRQAQRTQAARQLAAVGSLQTVLLLSGTPVVNQPADLLPQLDILRRTADLGGWKHFTDRYCIRSPWGGFARGGRNLEELNARMRATGMYLRREKAQVLMELPAKTRVRVPVELADRRAYDQALAECAKRLRDARAEKELARREGRKPEGWSQAAAVMGITELRKQAALGKLKAASAWLKEQAEGEKLVIFAHHREVVLEISRALDGAPVVMGDMSTEDRQAAVERFQRDTACRAIVMNLRAGGVGLTLTAASNVVFVESGWTPGDNDQAEDRCHRIGQQEAVTAWYLEAEGTIDQWLSDLVEEKRKTVDAATEGSEDALASTVEQLARMVETHSR